MQFYNLVYNHGILGICGADIPRVLFGGILKVHVYKNNQQSYNNSSEY
jgi:hypothetical protein